jgi:sulfite reductase (NADPH) hemoprotein beta-component
VHASTRYERRKRDIGLYAMNYGTAYVASVAVYSSYTQVLRALMEADAYPGMVMVHATKVKVNGEYTTGLSVTILIPSYVLF